MGTHTASRGRQGSTIRRIVDTWSLGEIAQRLELFAIISEQMAKEDQNSDFLAGWDQGTISAYRTAAQLVREAMK